jgi:hypothetical protein
MYHHFLKLNEKSKLKTIKNRYKKGENINFILNLIFRINFVLSVTQNYKMIMYLKTY